MGEWAFAWRAVCVCVCGGRWSARRSPPSRGYTEGPAPHKQGDKLILWRTAHLRHLYISSTARCSTCSAHRQGAVEGCGGRGVKGGLRRERCGERGAERGVRREGSRGRGVEGGVRREGCGGRGADASGTAPISPPSSLPSVFLPCLAPASHPRQGQVRGHRGRRGHCGPLRAGLPPR
jgi:hypothetical protein